MKKTMVSLLTVSFMISLLACGSETGTASSTDVSNSVAASTVAEDSRAAESDASVKEKTEEKVEEKAEEAAAEVSEMTFEAFTPIDNDECSVTIKELDPDNMWGYTIKVGLENKSSEKTYMFSVNTASVNGVEEDPLFAVEVAPGKKANEEITFSSSNLEDNGITDFTDIEVAFRVYDSNDWSADAVANETFHIYPYGEDKAVFFVREQQASDQVLADNDRVTVLITDKIDDPIWGYTLKLFITNKTDTEMMVSVEEATVNGYMADPFFAKSVQPGKCAFTSMSWADSTLEENDIAEIEEIEFRLRVYDSNNWSGDDLFNEVVKVIP